MFRFFLFLFLTLIYVELAEAEPSHGVGAGLAAATKTAAFWDSLPASDTSVDLSLETETEWRSACQATPVENTPLNDNPNFCRVSLFTDHHCVARMGLNPNLAFSIKHNGKAVAVPREKIQIYTMTDNHTLFATKRDNSVSGDAALLSIITECYKLRFLRPIALGDPSTLTNPVYFQKRREPIERTEANGTTRIVNPGGGRRLAGYYDGEANGLTHFSVPIPQGLSVNGGDSGGAVYDGFGRLIGSIIGSSDPQAEKAEGSFTVVLDRQAIPWVKRQLAALQAARPGSGIVSMNVKSPDSRPRFAVEDGTLVAAAQPAKIGMPTQSQRYFVDGNEVAYLPLRNGHAGGEIAGTPVPQGALGYRAGENGGVEFVGPGQLNQKPPQAIFASNSRYAVEEPQPEPEVSLPAPAPRQMTAAQRQAIHAYENEMTYPDGERRYPFSRQNPAMFRDIPPGGTGKIIVAYFGPRRTDVEALAATHPLFEARNYPIGGPEYNHARDFGVSALAIDGLGRKISRYPNGPIEALQILMGSQDPERLRQYLAAKAVTQAPLVVEKPAAKPAPQFASMPRFAIDNGDEVSGSRHVPQPAPAPAPDPAPAPAPQKPAAPSPYRFAIDDGSTVQSGQATPSPVTADPGFRFASLERSSNHLVPGTDSATRQPAGNLAFNPSGLAPLLNNNCVKCHNGNLAPVFPQFLGNWTEWERRLLANDKDARSWLTRLNSHVVHGQMLREAKLSRHEGTGKEYADFIAFQFNRFNAHLAGEPRIGSELATEMIDPNNRALYRSLLASANIPDPDVRKSLLEYDGLYDSIGAPPWSWDPHGGESGRRGQRPVGREPASPPLPHLFDRDADGSFTWREPFRKGFAIGANTQGLDGFIVVRFPRDASGNVLPGVKGFEQKPTSRAGDLNSPYASFPEGTQVFQVLYSKSLGEPVVVDVESRQKRIAADGTVTWVGNSNRQDASRENVTEWVNANLATLPQDDAQKILASVQSTQHDEVRSELGASRQGGNIFIENGARTNTIYGSKSQLAGVSKATLLRMYREMPMESALGSKGWQLEPTQMFRDSHRGIPINSKTCNNCHRNAGEEFRHVFDQAGLYSGAVSAYGNVGGYDGILSAPWFSREALSYYGVSVLPEMRSDWAKFFRNYDPARDPDSLYRRNPRSQ